MNIMKKKVLIIADFPPDRLESMIRYSQLLHRMYSRFHIAHVIQPLPVVSGIKILPKIVAKYLAYVDKLIIFPFILFFKSRKYHRIHIADHGYSFYSFFVPSSKSVVTCHDLLAAKAVLSGFNLHARFSPVNKFLQRLILLGLKKSRLIVFDSISSMDDYTNFVTPPPQQKRAVIHLPLNSPFQSNINSIRLRDSESQQIPSTPYLLMIGSNHPRKNRKTALKILERIGTQSSFYLVFSGGPLTYEENQFLLNHPLGNRLISIVKPSHDLLNVLYLKAHSLLFPSYAEGYGWPIIEAQCCGCPVIASNTTSIPEVAGNGALLAHPDDVDSFSDFVMALQDKQFRHQMIELGYQNLHRFDETFLANKVLDFVLP